MYNIQQQSNLVAILFERWSILENALIVSHSEKNLDVIHRILRSLPCPNIKTAKTCGEAKRFSQDQNYDLYLINSPVNNDSGETLALDLVQFGTSQVIVFVNNDNYDYMSHRVEDYGVLTIPKPFNKNNLMSALKLAKATQNRLLKIHKQNIKLTQKIDDIKVINRAKLVLITHLNMGETAAHRYIEKKAMDTRSSRRKVSETILNLYEL